MVASFALGGAVVYAFVQIVNVCMVLAEARMRCTVDKICWLEFSSRQDKWLVLWHLSSLPVGTNSLTILVSRGLQARSILLINPIFSGKLFHMKVHDPGT